MELPTTTWPECLLRDLLVAISNRCANLKQNANESKIASWVTDNFPGFWSEATQAAKYAQESLPPLADSLRTQGSEIESEARSYQPHATRQKMMTPQEFVGRVKDFKQQLDFTLKSIGAGQSSSKQAPQWDKLTEDRNRWLYEQCQACTPYKNIISELRQHKEWQRITSVQGVKKAATTYAERKNLSPIPIRQNGRPKKKK